MNKKVKLGIGLGICAVYLSALVAVPLSSYIRYNNQVNEIESEKIEKDNKTLKELKVSLKEGVKYFDNGRCVPIKEHFVVEAKYGGTYDDPITKILEQEDYEMSFANSFAREGGDVSFKYDSKVTTINLKLEAVVPTSIEISQRPNIIVYKIGDTFSSDGMKVLVKYNDGSQKEIKNYVISNTNPLTASDTYVEVSYTEKDVIVTTKCDIKVSFQVNDGEIKSLFVEDKSILSGSKLEDAGNVYATYESGNKKILPNTEYSFVSDDVAILGTKYNAKVVLSSNQNIYKDINVSVFTKVEGESATGTNTVNTKSVDDFSFDEDGNFVVNGKVSVNNGGFKTDIVTDDLTKEKRLKFTFDAGNHTNGTLSIRAANFNWNGEHMDCAYFKNIFDIYVNGKQTSFADDAILPAFEVTEDMIKAANNIKAADVGYNCFFNINLADINLLNGINSVELVLNLDNGPEVNTWSETADIKMDYFKVEVNSDVPTHTLTKVDGKEASCSHTGIQEHYSCKTCGDNYLDEACTQILLDTTIEKGDHKFEGLKDGGEKHYSTCTVCKEKIESDHEFEIKSSNQNGHTKECECGKKVTENHTYKVVAYSSKVYNEGEVLDETAFIFSGLCECGHESGKVSNYTVTFNEENASANSKATIKSGEEEYIVAIPVNNKLQAESYLTESGRNYSVSYTYNLVEEGKGSDGSASVGVQSENGNVNKPELKNSVITLKINSDTSRKINLSMKAASCYMENKPFHLEDVADLSINGVNQPFADNANVVGGGTKWFGWEDVNIADIQLVEGENTILISINYDLTKVQEHANGKGDGPFNVDFFNIRYL